MNKYFIGFELPAEHRGKLVNAQERVRADLAPTTRILGMDEFHITALFLGKCPRSAAEDICNNLAWGFGSLRFRFDNTTVFDGPSGPHALVLKLHDLYGNAEMMHRVLRDAATAHPEIGFKGKRWPYNPHVTLAKCEGPGDLALFEAQHVINCELSHYVTRHEFYCDSLVLFEKCEGMTCYEPHRMLQLR